MARGAALFFAIIRESARGARRDGAPAAASPLARAGCGAVRSAQWVAGAARSSRRPFATTSRLAPTSANTAIHNVA